MCARAYDDTNALRENTISKSEAPNVAKNTEQPVVSKRKKTSKDESEGEKKKKKLKRNVK